MRAERQLRQSTPALDGTSRPGAAGPPPAGPVVLTDPKLRHYPESRFGGFADGDQLVTFYTRVRALMRSSFTVLDVGCGRGAQVPDQTPTQLELKTLRTGCAKVIGIDVDPAGQHNPLVDEFHLIAADGSWPLTDASVDLAVSDYVLEHVDDPGQFFSECRRVIKPGGYLCMRTTNAMSYFGVAARLTPNRAHAAVVQRAYVNPREQADVFPTRYRCNTVGAIRRILRRHGFEHCVYGYQSDPAHFGFSRVLYSFGVLHQRYAPRRIRTSIFIFARRR
jgi:SAM-dependent methyltransferase